MSSHKLQELTHSSWHWKLYHATLPLNKRIQSNDMETVDKASCTVQFWFCKSTHTIICLEMSGRIYTQMLSGEISGYFSFKCMAFYNKHLLFFTLSLWEKKLWLFTEHLLCYTWCQVVTPLKFLKSKNFSQMWKLKHFNVLNSCSHI